MGSRGRKEGKEKVKYKKGLFVWVSGGKGKEKGNSWRSEKNKV